MSKELVCSWLDLPADTWPPDHYALLGLEPGDSDIQRIEEHVHERLMRLRPYQLNHPDEVTEAMNRLAHAFTCLTDPESKRKYDELVLGDQAASHDTSASLPALDPLGWMMGPWSRLAAVFPGKQAPLLNPDWARHPPPCRRHQGQKVSPAQSSAGATNGIPIARPSGEVSDSLSPTPVAKTAPRSPSCRYVWTRRGLYQRIQTTRHLLLHWERAGKYLNSLEWRLTKSREGMDLIRQLRAIRIALDNFPPLLGSPGRAGYWVASLARQEVVAPLFSALDQGQRESLARDWREGQLILREHRQYLRAEFRALRREGWWTRARLFLVSFFRHNRGAWLVTFGLIIVLLLLISARLLLLMAYP